MSDTAESSYRAAGNGRRLRTFRPTSLGPNASLLGLRIEGFYEWA